MMKRWTHIITIALLFLLPLQSVSALSNKEKQIVREVNSYLASIKTLKSEFQQFFDNNEKVSGFFYMKRPGLLKFDYNDPVPIRIISDGKNIYEIDDELKEMNKMPISNTPAVILTKKNIDLLRDFKVTKVAVIDSEIFITVDPKMKDFEVVTFVFHKSKNRLQLKKWIVVDITGNRTVIHLHNVRHNIPLGNGIFTLPRY